jgi:hypothetical protein
VLGCLAALSSFISRLGEKGLPLYRLLKKHEHFSWTIETQKVLDRVKVTLAHTPILTPPRDDESLYLYVAATTQVVSTVIVVERTEEAKGTPYQSKGRCTTSARCCPRAKRGTHKSRSCSTRWCLHDANCGTTSRPIWSRWSHRSRWERSSAIRTPRVGSRSGP